MSKNSLSIQSSRRPRKRLVLLWAIVVSLLYINIIRLAAPLIQDSQVLAETAPVTQNAAQLDATTLVETYSAGNELSDVAEIGTPYCTGTTYTAPTNDVDNAPLAIKIDGPTYYSVRGTSISELRSAITNCEFRRPAGDYHAITTYQLNWRYSTAAYGDRCELRSTNISLLISQLMPRLASDANLSDTDRTKWNAYMEGLSSHEQGHVQIDTRYATELSDALQQIGPTSCESIGKTVKATINSYLAELNNANEAYDTRTEHGATQGARL